LRYAHRDNADLLEGTLAQDVNRLHPVGREVSESVDGGENRKARIIESRTMLNGARLHWSKGPPAQAKS
jgi:hypothetical protein